MQNHTVAPHRIHTWRRSIAQGLLIHLESVLASEFFLNDIPEVQSAYGNLYLLVERWGTGNARDDGQTAPMRSPIDRVA